MKILIIDESLFSRKIIEQALKPLGITCLHARDGKSAWKLLSEDSSIQLVTTSMVLTDTTGLKLLKRCRETKSLLKTDFIFITSNDDEQTRSKAFELGATNFLSKPFKPKTLINICKRLLFRDNLFYGSKIFIIDDSMVTRELIKKTLSFLGVNTFEATSGIEALEMLKSGLSVDLIITDMIMPGMNGTELTWKIRHLDNFHSVPIIMLSGDTKMANILNYFKAGISDYLCKPFISEELIARVRVHLNLYLQSQEAQDNMQELENLSRMKDEVLAVCSHDIRSPLNAILGNTELLLADAVPGTKSYAQDIQDSAMHLLDLVTDLLDAGKKQANESQQKVPLDLQQIILKVTRQLNSQILKKDLNLHTSLHKTMVLGDESSFKRIFLNLLSNAIKFTPNSGEISMSIVEKGNKALITISDSGIGIPKGMIPKLFDKYTEASRSGTDGEASTGLGMSIVKELIEANMGSITVESKEGEGTTFSLLFPFADIEVKAETTNAKETEPIELDEEKITKAKVLIADDNFANLRLLEKILTKLGINQITKANDGLELLEAFDQHALDEPFDLIITDIEMPGKNGDDATKLIRAQENVHQPYIVALSGHSQEFYTEGLFNKVLLKPVLRNDLLRTLAEFCNK